jgi:hypothetical protein
MIGLHQLTMKYTAKIGGSVIESIWHAVGHESRIRLLGHISESKTTTFLSSIDVFGFPSVNSFQGLGITLAEGNSLGNSSTYKKFI